MTLSVHKVSASIEQSASLACDDWDSVEHLLLLQAERIDSWTTPTLFIADPRQPIANFYQFTRNALVFDERARDVMLDLFEACGQIFPLDVEGLGRQLYLLNVLEVADAIDEQKSRWDINPDGERAALLDFHFRKEALLERCSIFKIPEIFLNPVLACHDSTAGSDDFMTRYQTEALTGLKFRKLWEERPE